MMLDGKNALVTGSGSGIGEATAKRIAAEGGRVLVTDVNEAGGQRVVEEITAAGGVAEFLRIDISEPAEVEKMVAAVVDTWGSLDLAVNNAGFAEQPGPMHLLEPAVFDKVMSVDLRGTWLCMRAELAYYVEHGGGVIVNVASGAGTKGTAGLTAYSAAKHAVVGLTRTGAVDYIKQNIRINAVAPGTIRTPAMESFGADQLKIWEDLMPTGRMGTTEEIAAGIVWLLSDQASYTTGSILEMDGGYMQS